MKRSNRLLSSILAFAATAGQGLGFGGGHRPELEPLLPASKPASPFRAKEGPKSINGRPKQKRCSNEERRVTRWAERQRRRRAQRMLRR
jgi:hypothetical protein